MQVILSSWYERNKLCRSAHTLLNCPAVASYDNPSTCDSSQEIHQDKLDKDKLY